MKETRHDIFPPHPLKAHLLLTDEEHNASVSWTLSCSSYLHKSSASPELIKTDDQLGTEMGTGGRFPHNRGFSVLLISGTLGGSI